MFDRLWTERPLGQFGVGAIPGGAMFREFDERGIVAEWHRRDLEALLRALDAEHALLNRRDEKGALLPIDLATASEGTEHGPAEPESAEA